MVSVSGLAGGRYSLSEVNRAPISIFPNPPLSAPSTRSKLLEAVDALYSIANSRGQGDIDKALHVIKNL